MAFNPAEPRDERGRWTDAGGSAGTSVAHSSPGHNDHIGAYARAFASGAISTAKVSGGIGAAYGAATGGVFAGPLGAISGAVTGGIGGVVGGVITGGVSGVIARHNQELERERRAAKKSGAPPPEGFWRSGGGHAVKFAAGVAAGIGSVFAGAAAANAAGAGINRTFYGGSAGGPFRDSSSSSSDRQGGPQYKSFSERMADFQKRKEEAQKAGVESEYKRMAERAAEKARMDPARRKADALRAMANDRGIGPEERAAFKAKADEMLKRHRAGPTTGRHVATKH